MELSYAEDTAKRCLGSTLPGRLLHSRRVAAIATLHAQRLNLDVALVSAAAWLHDIGYAPRLVDTGFHPIDGARFLRRTGWPDEVCSLVAHHSCARVEAERRGLTVALCEFSDVAGLARDVLWASDATTGPLGERVSVSDRAAEVVRRYGGEHVVAQCMAVIKPDLAQAVTNVKQAEQRVLNVNQYRCSSS